MTQHQKYQLTGDIYGTKLNQQTDNQDEKTILDELRNEIAKQQCITSILVHRLTELDCLFLQSTYLDPKEAAKRMAQYWQTRASLWGDDDFENQELMPSQKDGLQQETKSKCCKLLPHQDQFGRPLILIDWGCFLDCPYTVDGCQHELWDVLHQAMRGTDSKQKGRVVILINATKLRLDTYDRMMFRMIFDQLNMMPMISILHFCSFSKDSADIIVPFLRFQMGKSLRARSFVHNGINDCRELEMYGIPQHAQPLFLRSQQCNKKRWNKFIFSSHFHHDHKAREA
mmetsp:Transcript_22555/g.34483  ORF Transcript_22555/g.34483 Transcript_22555/m.34483 type:complete len:285 (+) Transcript_22555:3-857(+)